MKITSPVFENQQLIPPKYTCDGDNVNPPLEISDVPPETVSLLLIVEDPDAPAGTWDHWLVWNIDPKTTSIEEDSFPEGAEQGTNSFGDEGYGGPCPPSDTHRYFFKLYALDIRLSLGPQATGEDLEEAIDGHVLDQVELVGLYKKTNNFS